MTGWQAERVQQLEDEVSDLKAEIVAQALKIDNLESLRDQVLGMSWATKTIIQAVWVMFGAAGLIAVVKFFVWVVSPMRGH